jgi:hypothetical protein
MRTTAFGLGLLVLLAGIALFGFYHRFEPPSQPVVVTSQGPTVARLERLARLVASRAQIVDVLVGETDKCRGVWLIRGDALLAIDLDRAQITEKNEETRKATILLPQPTILQPRVDHEHSRVFEIRSLTFIPWHSDQDRVRDAVYLQAQRLVSQAAGSKENIDNAKRAAEVIIGAFFEQFGWEVKVVWEGTPGAEAATPIPKASIEKKP